MKSGRKCSNCRERGFSLIEMLIVVGILGLIIGAVFSQINVAQQRSYTEQVRLDDFQVNTGALMTSLTSVPPIL